MLFDLPLEELQTYRPALQEPDDFDWFWQNTLKENHDIPVDAKFNPIDVGLTLVDVYDVTFRGYQGDRVKGWMLLPKKTSKPLPCVVEFDGYGGGRGHPLERLSWSISGYAHFIMDIRGQGSSWRSGDTPDASTGELTPQFPGFMTRGVLSPDTYYYRRVFTDAVRSIEAARSFPRVDPGKIAVTGGSQGGGITLAVSGLVPDLLAVMPDVPFLCHMRKATEITNEYPYQEIVNFCKVHRDKVEAIFKTLSYFDGVHFSARAKAPALFSAGLMDEICPPRTVFAAFNHYQGEKEIRTYPYNQHEGGQVTQHVEKLKFMKRLLAE